FLPGERVLFAGDLVENRFLPIFPDDDVRPSRWIAVLEELERLEPAVVVPGHGEPGTTELIAAARDYLVDVRGRVREALGSGNEAGALAALEPQIAARYADWDAHEWIAPAIGAFAAEARA